MPILFLGFCIKCYECPLSRIPTKNYDGHICYNMNNGFNIIGDVKECSKNQYCFEATTIETKSTKENRTILVERYCASVKLESYVINSCESETVNPFTKSKNCFCDTNLCNFSTSLEIDEGFGMGTIVFITIGVISVGIIGTVLIISELKQLNKKFSTAQSTPECKLFI